MRRHARADTEPKFLDGKWLGLMTRSDEDLIGTPLGVVRSESVKRLPKGQNCDASMLRHVRGTPRMPVPGVDSTRIPVRPNAPDDDDGSDSSDSDDDQDGTTKAKRRRTTESPDREVPIDEHRTPTAEKPAADKSTRPNPSVAHIPPENVPGPPPDQLRRYVKDDELETFCKTPGCRTCSNMKRRGMTHQPGMHDNDSDLLA